MVPGGRKDIAETENGVLVHVGVLVGSRTQSDHGPDSGPFPVPVPVPFSDPATFLTIPDFCLVLVPSLSGPCPADGGRNNDHYSGRLE